ncbi:MAG: tRNA (5-methylaminomethyl-2-thiouridylate)-methyltransferase [bacterium]
MTTNPIRVVGLVSGGLDSLLASRVMQKIGADVHLVSFKTACWTFDRGVPDPHHTVDSLAERLGLPLTTMDVTDEYLDILRNPRYGRGTAFNPCIDCKIFMLKKAREFMDRIGAELVFTGEVIGQRPMSQNRQAMRSVERDSGLKGRLLRPLCAHSLPPTIPEQEGRIDRSQLLNITGRSRKPQIALAEEFGFDTIPPVGGGCILTDKHFGARMFDLLDHGQFDLSNILLSKVGRHFRLSQTAKAVVGRDEAENERIVKLAEPGDRLVELKHFPGPTTLLRGQINEEHITQTAALTWRYSDAKDRQQATSLTVTEPGGETEILSLDEFPEITAELI